MLLFYFHIMLVGFFGLFLFLVTFHGSVRERFLLSSVYSVSLYKFCLKLPFSPEENCLLQAL